MEMLLMIVCALLIAMVLLQSSKASDANAGGIISGGNAMLFAATKERGSEKFITRFTYVLGISFILLSLILSF